MWSDIDCVIRYRLLLKESWYWSWINLRRVYTVNRHYCRPLSPCSEVLSMRLSLWCHVPSEICVYRALELMCGNSLVHRRSGYDLKNVISNLVLLVIIFKSSYANALRWMPRDLNGNNSGIGSCNGLLLWGGPENTIIIFPDAACCYDNHSLCEGGTLSTACKVKLNHLRLIELKLDC